MTTPVAMASTQPGEDEEAGVDRADDAFVTPAGVLGHQLGGGDTETEVEDVEVEDDAACESPDAEGGVTQLVEQDRRHGEQREHPSHRGAVVRDHVPGEVRWEPVRHRRTRVVGWQRDRIGRWRRRHGSMWSASVASQ
jgi:hypothetical protein